MESSIYTTMTAASKILENQEILANNLANISTPGFKAALASKIILKDTENYKNFNNINKKNIYNTYYNMTQGPLKYTNQPLDCSIIDEDGWFLVKNKNNEIAFTKNGHFKINSKGQLTIQDCEVVGEQGPIVIPQDIISVNICPNGIIKVKENKYSDDFAVGKLKLAKININHLIHQENGLYLSNESNKVNYNKYITNSITISPKTLEDSNVNIVENMIHMISDTRNFDMQMKILSIYDENTQLANKFLNITN